MALRQTIKLFLIILFLFGLTSCVNNGDEYKPGIEPGVKVELNKETINGSWEIYFYSKLVASDGLAISSLYRFTEFDGFTTTFEKGGAEKYDGVYYEKNVFDMEIIRGEYKLKTGNASGTDSIRFYFESKLTGEDTTTISSVPNMYENRFVHLSRYYGTAQNRQFFIEDIKYLRNLERAPNYYPADNPAFKKHIIDINKLLGTWELFSRSVKINGAPAAVDIKDYGTRMVFSIEGGKQVFRDYPPKSVTPLVVGEFRITDDVVNIKGEYLESGEIKKKSFKLWIQELSTAGSTELIVEGDKYRHKDDVLREIEEVSYHKRIK